MNSSQRKISRALLFVSLVCAFSTSLAQQPRRAPALRQSAAQKKETARAQRRAQAIELLIETADDARKFDDLLYRARIQTLAADALWPFEREKAGAVFRRAWEAASEADKEEREAALNESRARPDAPEIAAITDARDEVILKVATRDPKLADSFMRELLGEKDDGRGAQISSLRRTSRSALSPLGESRLALAQQLLHQHQFASAVEIAKLTISEGVSASLISFILTLRDWDAERADSLYLQLLNWTRAHLAETDGNAVLLMSAPVISPDLIAAIDEQGAMRFGTVAHELKAKSPLAPQLRTAFYEVAAAALMRLPLRTPEGNPLPDILARYYTIGRLLPSFAFEAAQFIPQLRAQSQALAGQIEDARRDLLDAKFDVYNLAPAREGDPLRSQIERLNAARDPKRREKLLLTVVRAAAQKRLWDRARSFAEQVETPALKRAALTFIAVSQIQDIAHTYADEKEDDFESLLKFLRTADVPPLALAWGYAQTSVITTRRKNSSSSVAEILNEAETAAARVEQGTHARVAAYGVVLQAEAQVDAARAWPMLAELVRAANAVEDFAGDEDSIDLSPDENSDEELAELLSINAEAFRLDKIFSTMSRLDFDKTLAETRNLEDELPRAFARLAIARTALEMK